MRIIYIIIGAMLSLHLAMPIMAQDNNFSRFTFGDNKWISLHYLLQVQGKFANVYNGETESADDNIYEKSYFLRRSRIILNGKVSENVSFFMETNDLKAGKNSDGYYENSESANNHIFTQSAFINYKIADELQIDVGMIPLPFMHQSRQSVASPLGVDINTAVVPLDGYSNAWRDTGIEIRGLLFNSPQGKKGFIDYKIGIWQGKTRKDVEVINEDSTTEEYRINPHDYPRYTGRLQFNFEDPETGFFYSGNYLGMRKIISIGYGIDFQKDVCRHNEKLKDYFAWTIDLTVDYRFLNNYILAFQAAYVDSMNNPAKSDYRLFSSDDKEIYDRGFINQTAYLLQTGVLLWNKVQPVVKYYKKVEERAIIKNNAIKDREISEMIYGINYFIHGHNANIKFEFAHSLGDQNKGSGSKYAILQFQIFI
ncbi:MAG: hypothetical protein SVR08_00260 [Spirochaetota bacterium]|nr:hypothetical protein [Spirochaetota bacterium]